MMHYWRDWSCLQAFRTIYQSLAAVIERIEYREHSHLRQPSCLANSKRLLSELWNAFAVDYFCWMEGVVWLMGGADTGESWLIVCSVRLLWQVLSTPDKWMFRSAEYLVIGYFCQNSTSLPTILVVKVEQSVECVCLDYYDLLVTVRRIQLVLGWVNVFRRVYHLGM